MRKSILISLTIFFPIVTIGQTSINDFLKSFNKEESVIFQKNKLHKLNTLSYDMSYIEKLEFRTETNEFDLRKQEYLVRVSPNSLKNVETQRQFQQTVRYMTEMELKATKNQAIRKRYDLVVNDIFLRKLLIIKKKQATLLKDKVTLLQRSISLPDFDIMELIEAEDEALKNLREILDFENAILTTENTILRNFSSNKKIQIKEEKLVTIEDVKIILEELKSAHVVHPKLEVQSAKVYNRMLEYQWEAAKTKFSLGYIQAKYGYEPNDKFRKSFSFGIGFDIPLKNLGRIELNELEINVQEAESHFRNLKNEISEEKYFQLQQLENLIRKNELIAQQLKDGQAEYALQEYQKIAETPPRALMKLRENTLKIEMLVQELAYEIMQTFVEYLDNSGLLIQMPMKNYLLKNHSLSEND